MLKYNQELVALEADICDEYCPLEGLSCGLPLVADIEKGLKQGVVWMCHSDSRRPCSATRVLAKKLGIKINLKTQQPVEEPEEFFALVDCY